MQSVTGRPVSGDDFFGREPELRSLEARMHDRNHVLLTGQRFMGKTSLARELGRRLASAGWTFLFTDVAGATCPEDVVTRIAKAAYPVPSLRSRFLAGMQRRFADSAGASSTAAFGVQFRAALTAENWRRHGEELFRHCAAHDKPVLLVIDELPLFLRRLLREHGGAQQVDVFLSWLRGVVPLPGGDSPVLIVTGSIGLIPLVARLGIPDRINHLEPFRLEPWDRDTSVECFRRLAQSSNLPAEDGVARAAYETLGSGIPHHVQSFFARLRDFAAKRQRDQLTVGDVADVYCTELLGPSGQSDLGHYETHLREALEDHNHTIAMEILAEAATRGGFGADARRCLDTLHSRLVADAPHRIAEVLDVLVHDGYLETTSDGRSPHFGFPSRLLRDWWAARYNGHHVSLPDCGAELAGGQP